jgi:D-methionine transport system ATP-binding protein
MIHLDGVSRTFAGPHGPVAALAGIDLEVRAGEVFGLIGRSGAGKSTLVRTINLLERPDAGRVLVDGQDLVALGRDGLNAARRGMGMVFQHFALLARRTAAENVALPLELAGVHRREIAERVDRLLALVGLADRRDQYPAQLSGGQKQRVGIARALAHGPRILLCDEATSALDPETTTQILDLVRDLRDRLDLTVVLVTHEMGAVKAIADRVAVLEAGRVIEAGDVFDVFTRPRTATARRFVAEVIGHDAPAAALARAPAGAALLRAVLTGPAVDRPVIAEARARFGVELTILHGRVDEIRGRPFGILALAASGPGDRVAAAAAWMRGLGIALEEIGHAVHAADARPAA